MVARLFLAVTLLAALATSASAHPGVDGARASYQEGELAIALARLEEAEADPNLSQSDRLLLLWYRALCLYAQNKKADAERVFDQLIALEPLYEPSKVDANPKMKAVYGARVEAWRQAHGVTLERPSVDGARMSVALAGHPEEAATVVIFARVPGAGSFKTFPLPVTEGRAQGLLPDEELWQQAGKAGALEIVAEARNGRQAAIARLGDAVRPVALPVTRAQAESALNELRPVPVATVTPPTTTTNPVLPNDPPPPITPEETRPSTVRMAGLGVGAAFGALTGVALLTALLSGIVATVGYAGATVYPRHVGGDTEPGWNALLAALVGGVGTGVVMLVLAALSGVTAAACIALGLVVS